MMKKPSVPGKKPPTVRSSTPRASAAQATAAKEKPPRISSSTVQQNGRQIQQDNSLSNLQENSTQPLSFEEQSKAERLKLVENHLREKQKLNSQIQEQLIKVQELEYALKQAQDEAQHQASKSKEDIKRLKSRVQTLEIEKQGLSSEIEEKNKIIIKSLETMADKFSQKRDFVLHAQLIKQRRYIQHLTKMAKCYKSIETELSYQMNYIIETLRDDVIENKSVWNENGKLTLAKTRQLQSTFLSLRKKFEDLLSQTSFQFSQNLLKEYDLNSDKTLSSKQLTLQLEQRANRIIQNTLEQQGGQQEGQGRNQILNELREFVMVCLRHGLDVRVQENEYEVLRSNDELKNNALLSFSESSNPQKAQSQRVYRNSEVLQLADELDIDSKNVLQKYQGPSFLDCYLQGYSNQQAQGNVLTKSPHKMQQSQISVRSTQSGTSRRQNTEDFVVRIQQITNMDIALLLRHNKLLQCMLLESQNSLQKLNDFVQQQFKHLESEIRQSIFEPFRDIFEIYQKYHVNDKSQGYPMHLAKVFNLNCEKIYQGLANMLKLSEEDIFEGIKLARYPLITELNKQYKSQLLGEQI